MSPRSSASCSRAVRRQSSAARRAGFTLIEVMTAGALFVIGIVGVTYMQGASVRSNQDAYEAMVATNLARTWLERIKRDGLGWTARGLPDRGAMFSGRPLPAVASYFAPGVMPATGSGLWPLWAGESSGANYHGVEVGQIDPLDGARVVTADIYYCAFAWFTAGPLGAPDPMLDMRADVHVWWSRKAGLDLSNYAAMVAARGATGCEAVRYNPLAALPVSTRRVTLATMLHYVRP
jgi:type II secretory pathway pseudopilin PulG